MTSEASYEAVDAGRGVKRPARGTAGERRAGPARQFARALAGALAAALAGLTAAGAAPADPPIIDVHTHVFNLRYLPVRGILIARGVPKTVAEVLDRLLVGATPLADLARPADEVPAADALDVDTLSESAARNFILGRIQRVQADRPPGAPGAMNASGELLTPTERRALKKYVAGEPPRADLAPGESGDLALVGAALDKARFAPEGEKSYARFLATLIQDELAIARAARRDYPAVDLMVHHLMDMERPYDDRPSLPNSGQIERLALLAKRFPGQLLGFVAFDPFRRAEALAPVRAALESGAAVGVKFYPPSGYRASGNAAWPDKPSWWKFALRDQWKARYGGWSGADLDRVNRELFAYCAAHDIPLLAHCTPNGFEAVSGKNGYGQMADPRSWRAVLGEFPKLRLTLAHAGGGDSWFSDLPWDAATGFDKDAWDLATRYENVFLDFSYSDEVLDPWKLAALRRRFAALLPPAPAGRRPYAFGDKILYGSDWHMVAVLNDRARILSLLRSLFDEPALAPYRARFFAGNAVRFLRLADWSDDARIPPATQQKLRTLVERVRVAETTP